MIVYILPTFKVFFIYSKTGLSSIFNTIENLKLKYFLLFVVIMKQPSLSTKPTNHHKNSKETLGKNGKILPSIGNIGYFKVE